MIMVNIITTEANLTWGVLPFPESLIIFPPKKYLQSIAEEMYVDMLYI